MDLCLEREPGHWVTQEERNEIIEVPDGYQVTKIRLNNSDLWTIIESGPDFEYININDVELFNKLFIENFKRGQFVTILDISMFFKNVDYICMRSVDFCTCDFYLEKKTYKNNGVVTMDKFHPDLIGLMYGLKGDSRDKYDSIFQHEGQKIKLVKTDGERFYFQYFTDTFKDAQKIVKKLLKDEEVSDDLLNFTMENYISLDPFRKFTPICIKYSKS